MPPTKFFIHYRVQINNCLFFSLFYCLFIHSRVRRVAIHIQIQQTTDCTVCALFFLLITYLRCCCVKYVWYAHTHTAKLYVCSIHTSAHENRLRLSLLLSCRLCLFKTNTHSKCMCRPTQKKLAWVCAWCALFIHCSPHRDKSAYHIQTLENPLQKADLSN